MISQVLMIVGASIFGVLGTLHLVYTFFTPKFMPRNPDVAQAMKDTSPVLTRETSMWRAWIGFNASHSLGAMTTAALYLVLATQHWRVVAESRALAPMAVVVSLAYLALAKVYWFRIPLWGILVATLCFAASTILIFV